MCKRAKARGPNTLTTHGHELEHALAHDHDHDHDHHSRGSGYGWWRCMPARRVSIAQSASAASCNAVRLV